jgi:hypothetical protein
MLAVAVAQLVMPLPQEVWVALAVGALVVKLVLVARQLLEPQTRAVAAVAEVLLAVHTPAVQVL